MANSRAAPAETSGAENDVPSPRRNSIGPQSEYPLGRHPGRDMASARSAASRGSPRPAPRCRRNGRPGWRSSAPSVACDRADAENVRERRRVAGVAPRLGRRAVRVPNRRHDEDALADRVLDGRGLEPRVRVLARIVRIADAAEAHVDDARAAIDRPVDRASLRVRRDRPVGAHDLGDQEVGPGSRLPRCPGCC